MVQRQVQTRAAGHQLLDTLVAADIPALPYEASGAIATAIAALVASAPGTLDTLNELAAALGNDANYAATITTALAGKQPLDSDLTAIAALTTTSYGRAFLALADAAAGRTALGLGTAATTAASAYEVAGAAAAAQAASQPLDSDLTAIAALTTTSTGRSLLAAADAAAIRTISGAEVAGAAASAQAASQPLDSDLTAIAALATTSFGRSRLIEADAAAARTAIGLGTLATQSGTFSGTSSGTNTGDQTNISGNAATVTTNANLTGDVTSVGNATTLGTVTVAKGGTNATTAAGARTNLGLVIGTDVQALDADLTAIAALTTTALGRSLLAAADAAAIRTISAAAVKSSQDLVLLTRYR